MALARPVPTPGYFWITARFMLRRQLHADVAIIVGERCGVFFTQRFLPQLRGKFPDSLEEQPGEFLFLSFSDIHEFGIV